MTKKETQKHIKPGRLLYLEWVDSSSNARTWTHLDDVVADRMESPCKSVGWVVNETKNFITLVSTIDGVNKPEDRCCAGDISIPKCAIVKRRVLRWAGQ